MARARPAVTAPGMVGRQDSRDVDHIEVISYVLVRKGRGAEGGCEEAAPSKQVRPQVAVLAGQAENTNSGRLSDTISSFN